jgi:excinuclease ABC subunit A
VIDRLTAGRQNRGRLAEAVESAIRLSGGAVVIDRESSTGVRPEKRPAESDEEGDEDS